MIWRLFHDEEGQDIIEYALLASLISIAAILVIALIGPLLIIIYQRIVTALT
jgi:Flp pilus assembly pilin Flp